MIVIDPMKGEIGTSHAGRLALINGIQDIRQFRHLLIEKVENRDRRSRFRQLCSVTTDLLGMDLNFYLARHSILPFWYALPGGSVCTKTYQDLVLLWRKPIDGPIRGYSRFCRVCLDDDVKCVGFSWWHREHHVPGVDVCVHHGSPLICVRSKDAMWHLPSTYLKSPTIFEESSPDSNASIVQRYHQFSIKLLERNEEFIADQILDVIRKSCLKSGISLAHKDALSDTSLSQLVRRVFPHDWLSKHHPALLVSKETRKGWHINKTVNGQYSNGITVTMILTYLFGSVYEFESELGNLKNSDNVSQTALYSLKSPRNFIQLFIDAKGDICSASAKSGFEPGIISMYRRKHGIPVLSKIAVQLKEEALRRLGRATPEELERWGQLMRTYWNEHNWERSRFLDDVYEFLKISSQTS